LARNSSPEFDRVFAPIGLEVGATTPEEIAVSIVAELIAVHRKCPVALPHLSNRLRESD
jgi:xanthine dehydrogenase accessory factor